MEIIKSHTDIEQSKKLAEILPHESADMIWYGIYYGMNAQYHLLRGEDNEFGAIAINKEFCKTLFKTGDEYVVWLPCWSLTALLDVLPNSTISKRNNKYRCHVLIQNTCHIGDTTDNPIDTCYKIILRLHKENLL